LCHKPSSSRIGHQGQVNRYSFPVRLLPPPLHAGLSRRNNIPITFRSPLK
jgi:hypothetical protein